MGSLDKVINIGAMLVVVTGITTIVAHPASAAIIKALGDAFSSAMKAAQGK